MIALLPVIVAIRGLLLLKVMGRFEVEEATSEMLRPFLNFAGEGFLKVMLCDLLKTAR